jgi:iron complex outermembrane receptor protein
VFAGNLPADRATREATGQPATVVAEFENRGTANADGFDINARYQMELGASSLTFDGQGTLITTYESSEFGDILSSRNFTNGFGSTPELKVNAGVTWDMGPQSANLTARYISDYNDDQNDVTVDSQTTFDLRYSYAMDSFLGSVGTVVGLGVTNVFDEDPPRLASRPFFDTEVHDPRGRQIFVNIKHSY